jgi:hypothetical protein
MNSAPMVNQRLVRLLPLPFACGAILLAACVGADNAPTASPTPSAVPSSAPTTAAPTPIASTPTVTPPSPEPVQCPVDSSICEFAISLQALLAAGDLDGLLERAAPVAATCPGGGIGGPSPRLCAGATSGEQREGYWDVQAGEGLVVSEDEFRAALGRWLAAIGSADGNDERGVGELQLGAVSCTREPDARSGDCLASGIRAHYTFVNSTGADPAQGTGLPGERTTFHLSVRRVSDELRVDGVGTIVPPNAALDALTINAVTPEGNPALIEFYPWAVVGPLRVHEIEAHGLRFAYPSRLEGADESCLPVAQPTALTFTRHIAITVTGGSGTLEDAAQSWLDSHSAEAFSRDVTSLDGVPGQRIEYRISGSGRSGVLTVAVDDGRAYWFVFEPRGEPSCGESTPVEFYELLLLTARFLS